MSGRDAAGYTGGEHGADTMWCDQCGIHHGGFCPDDSEDDDDE